MNKEDLFSIIAICVCFAIILLCLPYIFTETETQKLTYSQRRDIAITFMCTEHNNWKCAKAFCGSLPLDSDRDKNE